MVAKNHTKRTDLSLKGKLTSRVFGLAFVQDGVQVLSITRL